MLFRFLVAALGIGLAYEVLTSPLLPNAASTKRDIPDTHALHERHTSHVGQHWSKRSPLSREAILPMRIGLKQSNLEAGHERLMEISNPLSVHYGKHMNASDSVDFFAPDQSSVDAVIGWLVASGITRTRIGQSANKQWIQFDASVDEAEDILLTDFYLWEDSAGNHEDVACEEYHVPVHIQEHIDYITPGIRLRQGSGDKKSKRQAKQRDTHARGDGSTRRLTKASDFIGDVFPGTNSTSCDAYITADCIRAQYGVPNGTTAAVGNELGIFEGLGDHYSEADLDLYLKTLYPELGIPAGTYPENRLIDGAVSSSENATIFWDGYIAPGAESTLDFQSSIPLIWPQKTVLFQTDDEFYENFGTPGYFNTFLDAIDGSYCTYSAFNETGDCTDPSCEDPSYPNPYWDMGYQGQLQCGVYEPTNVISISYDDVEAQLPDNYQKRQCNEYMKLGLQGITVVISSGDYGVGSFDGCTDDTIFTPAFPVTCPYLLTVGSTVLDRIDPSTPPTPWEKLEEVATTTFSSGGGFSNIFSVADYQQSSVQAYFDQVESSLDFASYNQTIVNGDFSSLAGSNKVYHSGGRGYPDVAAVGDRQLILFEQGWYTLGGTSLSTPLWAAILTLINEKRIAAGKSTIGFINPILYAHPEAFNDITVGSNPGCDSNQGFPAAIGWDPVTGLGSPNFTVLEDILFNA